MLSSLFLDKTCPEKMLHHQNRPIFKSDPILTGFEYVCSVDRLHLVTKLTQFRIFSLERRQI